MARTVEAVTFVPPGAENPGGQQLDQRIPLATFRELEPWEIKHPILPAKELGERGIELRKIVDRRLRLYKKSETQNREKVFLVGGARVEIPRSVSEQKERIGELMLDHAISVGGEYDGKDQLARFNYFMRTVGAVKLPHEQTVTIVDESGTKLVLPPADALTADWDGSRPGDGIYPVTLIGLDVVSRDSVISAMDKFKRELTVKE